MVYIIRFSKSSSCFWHEIRVCGCSAHEKMWAKSRAYAPGLYGQFPPLAWWLEDVARGRKMLAVEAVDDLSAFCELAAVSEEDDLSNYRAERSFVADDRLDGVERVVGLLRQVGAFLRNGTGEDVPHIVQIHHRVADALRAYFPDHALNRRVTGGVLSRFGNEAGRP